jgi:hydrogenase expression/formation protein HypC
MCLAIPVQVKQIVDDESAVVELNGVATRISTVLIEDVQLGDFVILHVGYALSKLDEDEAQKTIAALRQAGELD